MITIEGYSGCGIRVYRNTAPGASDYILEKSAASSGYVPRLLLQQQKQASFQKVNKLPHVVVPKILYIRQDVTSLCDAEGNPAPGKAQSCSIGMQFLHHVDAMAFLAKASLSHVKGFAATLLDIVDQYVQWSPVTPVPVKVFLEKLIDVQRIVGNNKNIDDVDKTFVCDTVIPALLSSLSANGEAASIALPLGVCHGDLTLSNILVAQQDHRDGDSLGDDDAFGLSSTPPSTPDGIPQVGVDQASKKRSTHPIKVVLIDFLDNFVESPLADMAKLCQDLKYAWSVRVSDHNNTIDAVHFFTVLEYLLKQLEDAYASKEWYQKYFRLLFVMNQLRVLQYSKEPIVAKYLMSTVREEFKLWSAEQRSD